MSTWRVGFGVDDRPTSLGRADGKPARPSPALLAYAEQRFGRFVPAVYGEVRAVRLTEAFEWDDGADAPAGGEQPRARAGAGGTRAGGGRRRSHGATPGPGYGSKGDDSWNCSGDSEIDACGVCRRMTP